MQGQVSAVALCSAWYDAFIRISILIHEHDETECTIMCVNDIKRSVIRVLVCFGVGICPGQQLDEKWKGIC